MKTYFHDEIFSLNRPEEEIEFIGHSLPHYRELYTGIKAGLHSEQFALRKAQISDFHSVHNKVYVDTLIALSKDHQVERPKLSTECAGLYYALEGYEYSLGGMYQAIDEMISGETSRALCFSMPGHHAHKNWGHGYCILNTQAAAVRYAQSVGFNKVIIIDWDHHHGDGTQEIFADDPTVYQISIHNATDLYMGIVGVIREGLTDNAHGHCNIPILDSTYPEGFFEELELSGEYYAGSKAIEVFEQALAQPPFIPDLIVVFAGQDAHKDDCGENISDWNTKDFITLTRLVLDAAERYSCPVLSTPGGGYRLETSIEVALAHYTVLCAY